MSDPISPLLKEETILIPIEKVTEAVLTCDSNHGQVHARRAFEFGYGKSLTAGAVMACAVQIPANAYIHFQAIKLFYGGAI